MIIPSFFLNRKTLKIVIFFFNNPVVFICITVASLQARIICANLVEPVVQKKRLLDVPNEFPLFKFYHPPFICGKNYSRLPNG